MSGQAEYVRTTYGVPAKRGGRVAVDGRSGVITSFRQGKLRVRFDGLRYSIPAHPTWRVEYLDEPQESSMCDGCGRLTNGFFSDGTLGEGWYCGWCDAVPAER